ncbi:N-6 DNA methylase [Sulfuricurvum sp.]|uniref:N-6 DNA methylase n=1 Tax=Sulfuricurvum sp. TaxID=2025608 RepID=UPI003BB1152E
MINKILSFIESHPSQMNSMDSLTFLYLLHTWKNLSDTAAIPKEICIEKYADGKVQFGQMGILFVELANHSEVFHSQIEKYSWKYHADSKTLNEYIQFVRDNLVFPNVSEAFNVLSERQGSKFGEFAQPEELVDLLVKIADHDNPRSVYIPFTSGTLLAGELGKEANKKLFIENIYLNPVVLELSRYLDHVNMEYAINNPIYEPTFVDLETRTLKQFDVSVAIPPFGGIKAEKEIANIRWDRYRVADTLNGSSRNGEIALIEHTLSQTTGRAIFVISHGLLFRSAADWMIREQLLANKQIEAIITLPGNLFIQSVIPTAILVLNNQHTFSDVLFIDASKMTKRVGKKNVLTNIETIVDLLEKRESVEEVSALVSYEELKGNQNSLNPSRYIVSVDDQNIHNILEAHNTEKLSSLAVLQRSQLIKDEEIDDGIECRMVMTSDIPECGFLSSTERVIRVKEQKAKAETYRLHPYDILLGVKGSIGKVAIVGDIGESFWLANQSFQVISVSSLNEKDDAIYLYMYLKSAVGQHLLASITAGAAVPQIPTSALKDLVVPFRERKLKERALKHFYEEIEIYNEIEVLKDKISNINKHFFGQES